MIKLSNIYFLEEKHGRSVERLGRFGQSQMTIHISLSAVFYRS